MRMLLLIPVALAAGALAMPPAAPPAPASWGKCAMCHANARGGPAGIGPNLWGVVGARAGGRPGFSYSAALKKTGLVWNGPTLDRWLANPQAMAPGTSMPPVPLSPAERAVLAGYLMRLK